MSRVMPCERDRVERRYVRVGGIALKQPLLTYRSTHRRVHGAVEPIIGFRSNPFIEDGVIEERASGDNVSGLVSDYRDLDLP